MGFRRRDFLGLAAGAAVGVAASPAPWRAGASLARLSQDPPWLPEVPHGELKELATVSLACPSGMGIRVLTSGGRPLLVRGDRDHPLSQGGVTPIAQNEIPALHDPDRVLGPLGRDPSGRLEPVSWTAALDLLAEKLGRARGRVLGVGPARRGTLSELCAAFFAGTGLGEYLSMPSEAATAAAAVSVMGGSGQPGYDLDNARGLVLLGADAFESMPASVRFRKAWAGRDEAYSAFCGPVRGASAALCKDFLPMPAGEETRLALGLAWHLDRMGKISCRAPDLADFLALVRQRFGPDEILKTTGLPAEAMGRLAWWIAAGALPVPGSPCGEGLGLAPFVAGLALSVLTGRVNVPGGVFLTGDIPGAREALGLSRGGKGGLGMDHGQDGGGPGGQLPTGRDRLASSDPVGRFKDVALGLAQAPEVLLLLESDPASGLPSAELVERAIGKSPFKVCFAGRMTDSARLCDLILPTPLPLERWDDVSTPYGLAFACYGLARPLVRARADVRHLGDVLIELAERLGHPLGPSSFRRALRRRAFALEGASGYVSRRVPPWRVLAGEAQPAPEAGLWKALLDGGLWTSPDPVRSGLSLGAAFLAKATAPQVIDLDHPLKLAPQASLRCGAGQGVPVQSVTCLRPDEVRGGVSVARLNAATAWRLRLNPGERVRVLSPVGEVRAVLDVDESVMDGHLALLLGLGGDLGANVRKVEASAPEPETGVQVWAGCSVRLERI